MAPIKFEENIREKLQERELQPGKEAWNKLAVTLEKNPPKKNNRRLWMAVAAGFMGVLFVVSFLLNNNNAASTQQIVVDDNSNPPVEEKIIDDSNTEEPIIGNTAENIAEIISGQKENFSENENIKKNNTKQIVVSSRNIEKPFVEKKGVNPEEIEPPFEEQPTYDAVAFNTKEEKINKEEPVKTAEVIFIDNKVKEVITAIEQIKKDKNTITVEDIDALLNKAQREISNNRILNSGNRKVDATALLMDVEKELEQSFRDRVFEALGNGFNKIRTAVVERNN
jgi:hypothetical protein